jgi:MYXO-CTERM domain-containing protein
LIRRISGPDSVHGDGRLVFRGLQGGTNVHLLPVGSYAGGPATNLNVLISSIATDPGIDSSCTTSESQTPGALLLAGLLAALLAGVRIGKRVA